MRNFKVYWLTFLLIGCLSFQSCGGEEEKELPQPVVMVTIDNIDQNVTAFSVLSEDSQIVTDNIRFVDIYITTDEGELQLGVQNINELREGLCLKQRSYSFMPDAADCMTFQNGEYCQQAYADFERTSDMTSWSSFLNNGEIIITSCDSENNLVSGSFTGTLQRIGWPETLSISGIFENLVIEL